MASIRIHLPSNLPQLNGLFRKGVPKGHLLAPAARHAAAGDTAYLDHLEAVIDGVLTYSGQTGQDAEVQGLVDDLKSPSSQTVRGVRAHLETAWTLIGNGAEVRFVPTVNGKRTHDLDVEFHGSLFAVEVTTIQDEEDQRQIVKTWSELEARLRSATPTLSGELHVFSPITPQEQKRVVKFIQDKLGQGLPLDVSVSETGQPRHLTKSTCQQYDSATLRIKSGRPGCWYGSEGHMRQPSEADRSHAATRRKRKHGQLPPGIPGVIVLDATFAGLHDAEGLRAGAVSGATSTRPSGSSVAGVVVRFTVVEPLGEVHRFADWQGVPGAASQLDEYCAATAFKEDGPLPR